MNKYNLNQEYEYTDDYIRDEFSDIIEAIMLDRIHKIEEETIKIIKEVLMCGVDINDHGYILRIIEKVNDIKTGAILRERAEDNIYYKEKYGVDKTIVEIAIAANPQESKTPYNPKDDERPDYSYGSMTQEEYEKHEAIAQGPRL